jgi:hypothetical protein
MKTVLCTESFSRQAVFLPAILISVGEVCLTGIPASNEAGSQIALGTPKTNGLKLAQLELATGPFSVRPG